MPHLLRPRFLRGGFTLAAVLSSIAAAFYGGTLAFLYLSQERLLFALRSCPVTTGSISPSRSRKSGFRFRAPYSTHCISRSRIHADSSFSFTATRATSKRGRPVSIFTGAWDTTSSCSTIGVWKEHGQHAERGELHADVRAAWDAIAPRYRGKPVVVYGRSLGSGLAASLARDVHPALLVLVSPYTSIAAAAKRSYPLAPEWLLKYPLRTDAIIGEVTSPVVILHGRDDALIPSSDSERLRALARSPVELVLIDGAGHNDIHRFPAYLDAIAARLQQLTPR
jgi:pimeloyl-ACP methyl ester carboxylesterase